MHVYAFITIHCILSNYIFAAFCYSAFNMSLYHLTYADFYTTSTEERMKHAETTWHTGVCEIQEEERGSLKNTCATRGVRHGAQPVPRLSPPCRVQRVSWCSTGTSPRQGAQLLGTST